MKLIDGDRMILGRIASFVAKAAILGDNVAVVNCDKIVITGGRRSILEKQRSISKRRGKPNKGIFYERRPDYFVQKTIKRMFSQNSRGQTAFKRVKCYISTPEKYKDLNAELVKHADIKKIPNLKYITIGEICKTMGGKW
jgi:large subunit ribosomal protein L13